MKRALFWSALIVSLVISPLFLAGCVASRIWR